jgi:hypothetical protein
MESRKFSRENFPPPAGERMEFQLHRLEGGFQMIHQDVGELDACRLKPCATVG